MIKSIHSVNWGISNHLAFRILGSLKRRCAMYKPSTNELPNRHHQQYISYIYKFEQEISFKNKMIWNLTNILTDLHGGNLQGKNVQYFYFFYVALVTEKN